MPRIKIPSWFKYIKTIKWKIEKLKIKKKKRFSTDGNNKWYTYISFCHTHPLYWILKGIINDNIEHRSCNNTKNIKQIDNMLQKKNYIDTLLQISFRCNFIMNHSVF